MSLTNKLDKLLKRVEKPARYIGGELNSISKEPREDLTRFGFAFPDVYEIGMSYLGLQILYNILNKDENVFCERIFAPGIDMEELMKAEGTPLFTLESKTPVGELDFLGFTLQYELAFSNVLNMIKLGNIPILAKDRGENDPIIIAGGPCAFNPEPLAEVVDIFSIGDGERVLAEVFALHRKWKKSGAAKEEFYKQACRIQGIYVPRFYKPEYDEKGILVGYKKLYEGAPDRVMRAIVRDIQEVEFPTESIVPFIETVHDRSVVETFRGCTRGCRFCQAGIIYRPVRERSKDKITELAVEQLKKTGHEELSLLSLSTSDHSCFEDLAMDLMKICKELNVSLSLPSLRLDSFSFKVLQEIQGYKKSGLTFAPEAGTQRLRDAVNKGITEENIYSAVEQALELGWQNIKLYFMVGLPTETDEDLDGIVEIAKNIVEMNYKINGRKAGRFNVTVSVSNFVPKAHTPFQWHPQNTPEEFTRKHFYLKDKLRMKGITFNYHTTEASTLEAVFARGDRRLTPVLVAAVNNGCKFDSWTEHFKFASWQKAFEETGVDIGAYAFRERKLEEYLPWDIVNTGVTKDFLLKEHEKSKLCEITADCRKGCLECGMSKLTDCNVKGGI